MNAPVTATVAGGRPAAPRASESGRAHSAAPFASALDGVLSESRSAKAPERDAPDRAERAAHRDAEKDQRPADRSDAAARRAAAKDDRVEARADRAASRAAAKDDRVEARADRAASRAAAKDAAGTPETHTGPAVGETPAEDGTAPPLPVAGEETTEEAAPAAEPPRGGLPALWALVMGGSLASPPAVDAAGADVGADLPLALPSAPVTAAAAPAPVAPPVDPGSGVPATPAPATIGSIATGTGTPATEVATAAQAATAPAPAADALPAGFTAVLADAVGTPAGASAAQSAVSATTPATSTTPTVPVDVAPEAAPAAVPIVAVAPSIPAAGATASQDRSTSEAAGAAPATADAVAAPAGPSGEALSPDAGGAGQDGGADNAPAGVGATGSTVGPAAPVAASATAAVADVDGATGGAAALPVGAQVARQVAVLAGGPDGEHSMTLVLTPDTLGEVQVQVTLAKGAIELALRGAHEHGRAALLEALPELRRDLEAAGLNPSRLEVTRETGGSLLDRQPTQQQGFGERGGQQDRGENRSRPWGRPADIGGSGSPTPNRSTSSGVDVRV